MAHVDITGTQHYALGIGQPKSDVPSSTVATLALNPDNSIAGLVSPKDGSTSLLGGVPNPLGTNPVICAWLGNSLVANGDYMLQVLGKLSGGRLVSKYNFGAAGITTLGMLDPSYIDVKLAACPDASVVFISEGSNDATSFDVSQVYTRVTSLVSKAKAQNKTVVLCASPPRWISAIPAALPRTIDFCWLYYKVAKDTGSVFVDPWYDWRGTDGDYKAGYFAIDDGAGGTASHTHAGFNELYEMAAKRVWEALATGTGKPPNMEVLSDSRSAGLSKVISPRFDGMSADGNALMLAGQSTHWVAAMSAGTANCTITSETASPFRGNQLKLDFSGGITGGVYTLSRIFSNGVSANKPTSARVIAKAVVGASNLVNAAVRVYTSGGQMYADTTIMGTRRWDAAREMYSTSEFATSATGDLSKIIVEIQPLAGGTATGIVTISNADIYNMLSFGGA